MREGRTRDADLFHLSHSRSMCVFETKSKRFDENRSAGLQAYGIGIQYALYIYIYIYIYIIFMYIYIVCID